MERNSFENKRPPSSYLRLKGTKKTKKLSNTHYIDNELFLKKIIEYRRSVILAKKRKLSIPPVNEELGEFFLRIAQKLSTCSCFCNYQFKEDMILDGVENSIRCINNFNITPQEKPRSPFAYFTQVTYWAFLRRIKRERRVLASKFKAYEHFFVTEEISQSSYERPDGDHFFTESPFEYRAPKISIEQQHKQEEARGYMSDFIDTFEKSNKEKVKAKKERKIKKENFLSDLDIEFDISKYLDQ